MTDIDQSPYAWLSEHLVPQFEAPLTEVMKDVSREVSGAGVVFEILPRGALTFSMNAAFNFGPGKLVYVGVGIACGPEIHLTGVQEGARITCRSGFSEVLRDQGGVHEKTLGEGPQMELLPKANGNFDFSGYPRRRDELDQWANATVVYIRANENLIIESLRANQPK